MQARRLYVGSPLVFCALATVSLHVLGLAILGTRPPGPVLSQILQTICAFLAGMACLQASFRSSAFARSFWRLSAAGFFLWSGAQALGTYNLYFAPVAPQAAGPGAVLYFFSFTPMFASLFLSPAAGDQGRRWEAYLDFLQILIVSGTIYLLFLYVPWWRLSEQEWVSRRATTANLRNLLLCAGFALRALTTRSKRQRELYIRVGVPMALYSLGFWLGKRGISFWAVRLGSWFDLGWTLPFLLTVILAVSWQEEPSEKESARPLGFVPIILAFLLTLSLPAVASGLLVFRGYVSTPEVFLISGAAALVVICFFTRLILTQYRQNKTFERLQSSEAKILEWKNRYEAAVLASGQIIYDWSPRTNQVTFGGNFENMLGYSTDEIGGNNRWRELIHPDDLARYKKEMNRVLAIGAEALHIEYRVHRKNGRYLTIKDDGHFLLDESGKVEHMIGFITDISEQRLLEEQLRQSQKMEAVGRLAGGLAHDFNNLLTVIKGYSRMVLDEPRRKREEENFREIVAHIDSAADRAAALTRHLLAFSRKQVLQPKVIDLNALMVNLDKMLRRLIGEDIAIVTVAAPDLGSVKADPGQIELVIMNLVVNARDAMPKGGKLTLETTNVELDAEYARDHDGVEPGRYVMLAVSDTGAGMDAQTLALIFEPFFTTKELGRGTGLGLSTVYGIVKQSGGHIWVYSEPGRGTTFKIYLARVDEAAEHLPKLKVSAAVVRGTETILLVEDNEQVRELTHSVLAGSGYSVLVAENGPTVEKICAQHKEEIDLLLTDVVMPGVSGREVAKQVTARWPGVKVLFMSGYTENSIIHHGVLDDGTFFLAKPFTPSALTNKVREVLDHGTRTQ
jgi:PAS domain S-box-containing protein